MPYWAVEWGYDDTIIVSPFDYLIPDFSDFDWNFCKTRKQIN